MRVSSLLSDVRFVFPAAILLRLALLIYGHFQDQWSALKYTDIDYYVFTDAARYVSKHRSPYQRDTYRYTPLLAWLLYPTSWGGLWFDFGKVLFAGSDILAGWLIFRILQKSRSMSRARAVKYANIWLLNPMVAQISTRGSSEGLLAAMVMAMLWAVLDSRNRLAGCLLGISVHFKIYPFIYGASILCWLDISDTNSVRPQKQASPYQRITALVTPARITIAIYSFFTFMALNAAMFAIYGIPFLTETFTYHFIRTDHRHNFSPYNLLLYMNSSPAAASSSQWHPETLAFLPQLLLSAVLVPSLLAKKSLPGAMLLQTFLFVTYNKVCTSQYFLWYIAFLPLHLPGSRLLRSSYVGLTALLLWVAGQALWLQQGYQLEFLGNSTFMPGLWMACLVFHVVNVWIAGILIDDIRTPLLSKGGTKESSKD
ncbi:hypothetical protein FH972_021501 [Carpinus fangiana]|uniref:GPI mannosyltransferase 1 n=1 Tax=Carpinus fangiana TaxID=176857 RepID=A0A5N6KQ34_9ROSI|nr:hypothetical protein FH972_021501 [Carpinus fangiana]